MTKRAVGRSGDVFRFDVERTKALERSFDAVELDGPQQELIEDLTAIIAPALGLEPAACHALWMETIRNWQASRGKAAVTITGLPPAERARAALEIRDEFILVARGMLRSPGQRAALSSAIEDAFALYMKKYNRRKR